MSLRSVNRQHRCPVCNADHSCAVTEDGLYHCHHRQGEEVSGWVCLGVSKIGFGLYRREDDPRLDNREPRYRVPRDVMPTRSAVPLDPAGDSTSGDHRTRSLQIWLEHPARDMQRLAASSPQAQRWAKELGLPDPAVFEQLETCWLEGDDANRGELLCFPERDCLGETIGYSRRYLDGRKLAVGARGITIPRALTPTSFLCQGPIYLVEGASDTLALLAMGRNVIGRPSNVGGGDHLVTFLRKLPRERLDIVIVGENDQKTLSTVGSAETHLGAWPGREGAYRLAKRLADELGVTVRVAFPPPEYKDVREYFQAEMKRAPVCAWAENFVESVGIAWDHHCWLMADQQSPGQELRYASAGSFAATSAAILLLGSLSVLRTSPLDLLDLCGERVGAAVERARQTARLADPYAEERAAKVAIETARRDRQKYPCSNSRCLGFLRKRNGQPWIGEMRCESRRCLGCRQWLDCRERTNAQFRIREAERRGKPLVRIECAGLRQWKALRATLRRYGADYLRFHMSEENPLIVWTTFAPSRRSSWHAKAIPVDAESALTELQTLLELYDGDKRPISTSHSWKLPPAKEKTKNSIFIGKVDPHALDNIVAIADAVDAIVSPRLPRIADGSMLRCWDFLRPAGWNPAYRDHLFACWFSGEALPYRPPLDDPLREAVAHDFDDVAAVFG